MATARLDATYLIAGLVLDRRTREGVAGVQVEARDRDERFHDMLGQTFTDERGAFAIGFEPEDFGDHGPDHGPDLFFRLSIDGVLVKDTLPEALHNVQPGRTTVTLELDRPTLPDAKPDRVGVDQLVKVVDWWRASDFKGVAREGQGRLGTVAALLGGQASKQFKAWNFAPVTPSATRENTIVGQPLQQASSALAQQQVEVAEVRTVDASSRGVLRSLTDVPLTLKANDRVVLYQEDGVVKYYTRVPQTKVASIDQQAVATLDADVQQLKRQALDQQALQGELGRLREADAAQDQRIADSHQALRERGATVDELQRELQQLRQNNAEKDALLTQLRGDLGTLRTAHDNLASRVAISRLERLEEQVRVLVRAQGPQAVAPPEAHTPEAAAPGDAPGVAPQIAPPAPAAAAQVAKDGPAPQAKAAKPAKPKAAPAKAKPKRPS